jgi:hypothetical protein
LRVFPWKKALHALLVERTMRVLQCNLSRLYESKKHNMGFISGLQPDFVVCDIFPGAMPRALL